MDWTISVPEGTEIIRVELRGDFDLAAHPQLLSEVNDAIRKHPACSILFDNRQLHGGQMTPNEMVVSSGLFADSLAGMGGKRMAIIPSEGETERAENWTRITHSYTMTRIRVFRDEAEAVEWLTSDT